ncbi:MAG TPA: Hsp70 family protein [Acidobacteriota bacterium]|nr:Hsp70 family protein [Acidobacteriota bacterium]
MRLGIDFGTTRTVVAVADRGNYPVVCFHGANGDSRTWHPSVAAALPGQNPVFGFEAESNFGRPGWSFLRSFKRYLGSHSPDSTLQIGETSFSALDLMTRYLDQLKLDLLQRSNLDLTEDEPLEAFIAVPANANSNQRFITLESFSRAGFRVLGMMNEPSAGGIEFAHRFGNKQMARREHLVVYDLGGGTFDASVISVKGESFEVLANDGIARLGGDDFDEILKNRVLERLGITKLDSAAEFNLLELCREAKEGLNPNSRKISIDVGRVISKAPVVTLPVSEFYERCQPLVQRTIESVELAAKRGLGSGDSWDEVSALYLVGGSSDLPVVARTLRERYGRRVRRSPYPFAATAIGLAIAADRVKRQSLQEKFSRYFGVWREGECGRVITFDPIFSWETPLPQSGQPDLVSVRRYRPVHNLGFFRYLECSRVDSEGRPAGDITPWETLAFPFDPQLQKNNADGGEVHRLPDVENHLVEEHYRCDRAGIIQVTIADRTTGFSKSYRLRRGELAQG